jgi:O-antigen ligase
MVMDLSPIFCFEVGIAILLALWILCAKPEYGLFLYGLALGFPDIAIPLGTAINLRVDDVLIIFFLLRSVLWRPAPLASGQRKILKWQALLLMVCSLSAVVEFASGNPPWEYDTIKMIGCAVIVFALPRVLQSERRLRFLIAGLMCAGIALVLQIILRLGASSSNITTNFQRFKSAASFTTWNPNTIGQAAMLVVFAAGVGWIVFPKSPAGRFLWFSLSMGFALTPALVFVRGTSVSIIVGYVLFLCLARSWKWVLVFLMVFFAVFFYLQSKNRELVEDATQVDLATGEGMSDRFDRWNEAIKAIRAAPLLGQGFGQEWNYLSNQGSEGVAHNAYLSVWIELGIGGLALLLAVIYQFVAVGYSLYRRPQFQVCGALVLALTAAACLDSLALPTMYWEKLPTISLSIAVALAGICERNDLETAPLRARALEMEPLPQHS